LALFAKQMDEQLWFESTALRLEFQGLIKIALLISSI
jgi:hypothetical protein